MQPDKIVVGLDIGTTKVCAVVGRLNERGQLEVLGMGKAVSTGVVEGTVFNIDRTTDAITQSLQEAERMSGIDIGVVNVGLAGRHIKSIMQHGMYVRPNSEDVISVVDVENLNSTMYRTVVPDGRRIIHIIPQDYTIDSTMRVPDPVGSYGNKIEANFNVVLGDIKAMKNIESSVTRANLEIEEENGLMLEPIASSMSVLTEEERETGVVLVDIGGGTTDIAIFYKNILRHVAVIPYGGNAVTADIEKGCMVLNQQAEQLKTRYGHALELEVGVNSIIAIPGAQNRPAKEVSTKNLAGIIESRMDDIISMVHTQIIYSGYERQLIGGIVITGGGAQLKNIIELTEMITGMHARIGYPTVNLARKNIELVSDPMYATAIGLVWAGLKSFDYRINNYTERYGSEVERKINAPKASTSTSVGSGEKKSGWNNFLNNLKDKTLKIIMDDDLKKPDNY